MNRIDFMNRLSLLLADIPDNEREEALQYYNDYLNDAGVENEEEVLEALGTPEELAASIRRGLLEGSAQEGEFSERGYRESGGGSENEVACRQENGQSVFRERSAESREADHGRPEGDREQSAGGRDAYRKENVETSFFEAEAGRREDAAQGGTGGFGGRRKESEAQGGTGGFGGGHKKGAAQGGAGGFGGGHKKGAAQDGAGDFGGGRKDSAAPGNSGEFGGGRYSRAETGRADSADLDRRYRGGKQKDRSVGMTVLIVLLCILIAPVAIPILFAALLVVLILAVVLVFLVAVFGFTGIICIVAGVGSLFQSVAGLFTAPAGAIMGLGMSLMTIGFGILVTLGIGWAFAKAFPKAFRGLADFCGRLLHGKGESKG